MELSRNYYRFIKQYFKEIPEIFNLYQNNKLFETNAC